jgi:hypothetical protein
MNKPTAFVVLLIVASACKKDLSPHVQESSPPEASQSVTPSTRSAGPIKVRLPRNATEKTEFERECLKGPREYHAWMFGEVPEGTDATWDGLTKNKNEILEFCHGQVENVKLGIAGGNYVQVDSF